MTGRMAKATVPLLAYLGLSAALFWPALRHPDRLSPGGHDAVLFGWYFGWAAHALEHGQNVFVSPALNAPAGVNVMWNTSVLALGVVCIPLTQAIGAIAAATVVMFLATAFSAWTAYLVFRRMSGSATGAALGGLLLVFGPFTRAHAGHLHLLFTALLPLLVYLAYRIWIEPTRRPIATGVLLGVLVAVQLLVSEELLLLAALCAVPALVWFCLVYRRDVVRQLRSAAVTLTIGAVVACVLAAVPLYFQFRGQQALNEFVALPSPNDLGAFVRPDRTQYFFDSSDQLAAKGFGGGLAESSSYLGWPLIVLALAVAAVGIARRQRFPLWWTLAALSVVVLELGSPISIDERPLVTGPWAVIRRIPLFHGVFVARLSLFTTLAVAGLIAWTLAQLRGRVLVVAGVVTVAAMIPLIPRLPVPSVGLARTPVFFTTSAVDVIPQGATTVVMPQSQFPSTAGMEFQIRADYRFDLVGGYSVFRSPNGTNTFSPDIPRFVTLADQAGRSGIPLTADQLAAARSSWATSGVQDIVITRLQRGSAATANAMAQITGCRLRQVADVQLCQSP